MPFTVSGTNTYTYAPNYSSSTSTNFTWYTTSSSTAGTSWTTNVYTYDPNSWNGYARAGERYSRYDYEVDRALTPRPLALCAHGESPNACVTCTQERQRRQRLQTQLQRSRNKREDMAIAKAEVLLLAHLDAQQRAEYDAGRQFHAVCPRTGRRFRVRHGWSGNLDEYEGHRIAKRHCVHHGTQTPIEDNMLTQKFMIEAGLADELTRIANTVRV